MVDAAITVEYLSAGTNRHTAVADWSSNGVLAFGADSNIGFWTPSSKEPRGITGLSSGHKDVVKAVKFLPQLNSDGHSILISGSDDQTIKVWLLSPGVDGAQCLQTLHEHTAPVNCIAVLKSRGNSGNILLASGAADASIKIWAFSSNQLQLLQTLKPNPKFFPLSLALSALDEHDDVFVLAAAGTRDIIQVYVASGSDSPPDFKIQATLTGHEGWIRSLDFTWETDEPNSDLLLASASQDKYIRLWRVHQGRELPELAAAGSDPSRVAFLPGKSPSNKAYRLNSAGKDFSISFEALLLSHEDWIYSARWHSHVGGKLQLLSTSADNSLAIWEADLTSGIWVSMVRLGEISREKGATTATGSIGGFWTGLWAPDGKSVVCLGRTGSWRRWECDDEQDQWLPAIAISGHTKAVTGIAWAKNGDYLMTTSSDQTTRLHAPWKVDENHTWHEMSRPQIHGYDLNCIDTLGSSQFVSGADEKLMRVFGEPKAVARLLSKLSGTGEEGVDDMPDAANMPLLGLSNKAIDTVDDEQELQPANENDRDAIAPATVVRKSALEINHPPLEESLSRHTLWPEVEKLYGHGYEISCLAVSHDGKLIASACKASSINHAVIRLFETERWTEVKPPLTAHSLTVSRLRFSSDDKYLLSVGRDRQWAVFQRDSEDVLKYTLLQANPRGHSRMILDASWAASGEQWVFATAGRDKQVKIWAGKPEGEDSKLKFALVLSIPAENPVTAVDFLGRSAPGQDLILAIGTEAGKLSLCSIKAGSFSIIANASLKPELCLPKAVLQLSWRPSTVSVDTDNNVDALAIAGEDNSLRIYSTGGLGITGSSS